MDQRDREQRDPSTTRSSESRSSRSGETIEFPESGWTRTPRIFDQLDWASEALIYASILFGPWAFGTTDPWAINVMNWICYGIGLLLLGKWIVRLVCRYTPHRWGFSDAPKSWRKTASKCLTGALAVLTVVILLFCLVSAWNARATWVVGAGYFEYFDDYNPNLPHSYDAGSSWKAFYAYLALACFFWGLRDWVMGKTRIERHAFMAGEEKEDSGSKRSSSRSPGFRGFPTRLKRLLWVISGNAALLSLVSIVQRLDGGNKLLWLVEPRWNRTNQSQFGPYAYRSNAAQYLNLAWPLCLGFWWAMQRSFAENFRRTARLGQGAHVVLLPLAILIAIGPLVATSRGGVLIALLGSIAAVGLFILFAQRTTVATRIGITVLFSAIIGLGAWLGWEPLQKRLSSPTVRFATTAGDIYSSEASVFTRLTVPTLEEKKTIYLPILSPIQTFYTGPDSLVARILSNGQLQIYKVGTTTGDYVMKVVADFTKRFGGQDVELMWVKTDDLRIYVNGEPLETSELTRGNPPEWGTEVGISFVQNSYAKATGGYIEETRIFSRAVLPSDIPLFDEMPDLAMENGLVFYKDFTEEGLYSMLNADSSGREEIFQVAMKIHEDFPLFGSGPWSFAYVNSVYLENSYQTWQAFVHDDYLETLATFGIVGLTILLVMLGIVFLHWWVGQGIGQYFPFAAMVLIGLGGCLAHAKFDFPFQVYSVLHMFLINCCILMVTARRS